MDYDYDDDDDEEADREEEEDEGDNNNNNSSSSSGNKGGRSSSNGVIFKLLSRDSKGRFETRQLQVPEGNQMAIKLLKAEEEQRIERKILKEKVLQIQSLTAEVEV